MEARYTHTLAQHNPTCVVPTQALLIALKYFRKIELKLIESNSEALLLETQT